MSFKRHCEIGEIVNTKWFEKNTFSPGWQRPLYQSRVNNFVGKIRDGQFIPTIITLGKEKGKKLYVLIDGQHKGEGIKRSGHEVEVDLMIFEDLTEQEMKDIYEAMNDVKNHRMIDLITFYIGSSEWFDALLDIDKFPLNVSMKGGVNSIRIDAFTNILANGYKLTKYRSNISKRTIGFFIKEFDAEKYTIAKDFCNFFVGTFGQPSRDNALVYKPMIMYSIMKIWKANQDSFDEETMKKCFVNVLNDAGMLRFGTGVDRPMQELLISTIYSIINKGKSVNKFVPFWTEN